MTLQEIKERIAVYESKWGKLGHTNIMKPENELQHSELNERRNTMIKTTNDFYKFRQKVAIGKEANKLAHKATISPEELNERNFQNQLDNNTLIHAGKNFKYVAKEDVNGKPRYFYTQEEYDAFKNTGKSAGNAGDMAGKLVKSAANDVFKPENDRSKAVENYNNNAKDDSIRVIVEASKNGGGKAAASAFTNTPAWKNGLEIYEYVIDQGYDPRTISSNQTKSLGKDFNDFVKQIEDETNEYVKALPNDMQKDFIDECRRLSEKELDKLMKKETVLESVGDKLGEDLNKGIAKSNIGEAVTKNIKHSAFDEEDETPSYKTAADLRQEREESIMSEYRAFKARANKGAEKNRLSHSAVISPRDLNAKYEEELMKEYIAIHPENDDDIEHSSNGRAYINKIDKYYPDGSARYFYTQAEWDAYQEGLKRSNYNADKEADARQAKIDKQKADLAKRSGMENYTKYQENKRADEEADAKQAKIDEQKTRAKQKAGMEGYEQYQQDKKTEAQKADMAKRQGMEGREEWDKEQKAEKEANAKKIAEDRNNMGGYAAWKRRRDYINNQKKASEAADAAEAEKHEIERKAVKNSVEVTKNKAAAKAQEAAEAEKHEAESDKRIAEERAANAKKDTELKEAAIKAGQESASKLHAENEARDKEHKADKEKAKWNNLNNNVTSILEKASKKYDNQLEALNKEYDSIKDKSSPEAKAIKDKISQTNTKKDAELDKEIMTVVKDLGEIFESLEDKNGPEAKLLKAQAKRALDYSSNTKLAKVMGDANSWLNASMKYPKEV